MMQPLSCARASLRLLPGAVPRLMLLDYAAAKGRTVNESDFIRVIDSAGDIWLWPIMDELRLDVAVARTKQEAKKWRPK